MARCEVVHVVFLPFRLPVGLLLRGGPLLPYMLAVNRLCDVPVVLDSDPHAEPARRLRDESPRRPRCCLYPFPVCLDSALRRARYMLAFKEGDERHDVGEVGGY